MELENATTSLSPSLSSSPSPSSSPQPPTALQWVWLLQLVCAVLGLPANAFVLWLTGWRLRCRGLAIFIFSVAASDFLFLANSTLQIWTAAHGHRWPLGTPLCRLHRFLLDLAYYGGLFLLAAISLDRCLLLLAPLWYHCRRPARWPAGLCAAAWLLAGCCSAPGTASARASEVLPGLVVCRREWGRWTELLGWLEVALEGLLLPAGILLLCNGAALAVAAARRRRQRGGRLPARFQRLVAATLSGYLAIHLPFQLAQLLSHAFPRRFASLAYFAGLAFNVGSCLNPCLYLLLHSGACRRFARGDTGPAAPLPPGSVAPAPPPNPLPVPPGAATPLQLDTAAPVPPDATAPVPPGAPVPVPPSPPRPALPPP
ncbi:probable G-protein coupled receptor 152 [Aythya fuligula]|uniref:Probable G-protein coupled receptor 152 n=1 Tax=Aythya fuligula TaxID=219594 RepID=A0A6J3D067_AYTFU|nr:probable G-protein coupled receptor 152 [Aythya fuligula]